MAQCALAQEIKPAAIADSLWQIKSNQVNKLVDSVKLSASKWDSLRQAGLASYDSVAASTKTLPNGLTKYKSKIDSIQGRITFKIDSLTALPKPNRLLIKSLDSLRTGLDSIKQKIAIVPEGVKKAEEAVAKLQASVADKTSKMEAAINKKLALFNEQGANLPEGVKLPVTNLSLPGNLNMPTLEVGNLSLPAADLSQLKVDGLSLPDLKLPDANLDLPALDKSNLADINGLDKLGDIQSKTAQVGELSGQAGSLTEKFKDPDKLAEEFENRAKEMNELSRFEDATGQFAQMEKWRSDPEYVKEMALKQAKEQAVDHFAGKEKELLAAMEQLSGLKKKYKDADGVIDLLTKRQRPLENKPFIERVVPGISLQLASKNDVWWFDFNPYAGYQISGRLLTGLGWNERVAVNFKEKSYVQQDRIYGPRVYAEFKLKEGFFVKAESEWMNTFSTTVFPAFPQEETGRLWVWSSFAGIKNTFSLSKKVRGQVQILYNIYNPEKRSPYTSRLNVRFGVEYSLKKKRK
ncbi:MAG: hypothetical protein JNL53_20180 [Cyclobacteriaceae bacterium]|nr:hypothetical protein [Cyclobacteriaceae bacterium]